MACKGERRPDAGKPRRFQRGILIAVGRTSTGYRFPETPPRRHCKLNLAGARPYRAWSL
jgi:hypothetical protein